MLPRLWPYVIFVGALMIVLPFFDLTLAVTGSIPAATQQIVGVVLVVVGLAIFAWYKRQDAERQRLNRG